MADESLAKLRNVFLSKSLLLLKENTKIEANQTNIKQNNNNNNNNKRQHTTGNGTNVKKIKRKKNSSVEVLFLK